MALGPLWIWITLLTIVLLAAQLHHWGFGLDYWRTRDPQHRKAIRRAARIRRTWHRTGRKLSSLKQQADTKNRGKGKHAPPPRIPPIKHITTRPDELIIEFGTLEGVGRAEFARHADDLADAWRMSTVAVKQFGPGRIHVRAVFPPAGHRTAPAHLALPAPADSRPKVLLEDADAPPEAFDASVEPAVQMLLNPWTASELWGAVDLGDDTGNCPTIHITDQGHPAIWPTHVGAEVCLRMPKGHSRARYQKVLDELADALQVDSVQILESHRGQLTLELRTLDPLATGIRVPRPEVPVDLNRLNVGRIERGAPWRTPAIYRNRLTVGVMGSGKSGFLRSVLMAAAPAAHDGIVVNLMIDCKFGIEAAAARGLLHGVASTEHAAHRMLQWLWDEIIKPRGRYMEAHRIDKHVPTVEEPLYRIYIDELAELLDNPDLAKKIQRLLRKTMRVGRAIGVTVDGFSQDPSKDTLGKVRNLFHIRAGLRLTSDEEIAMVYGDHSAARRGAANTTIPDQGSEGVGYIADTSSKAIVRVRAYEVTTEDLDWAAATYPPYPRPELDALFAEPAVIADTSAEVDPLQVYTRTTPDIPPALPHEAEDDDSEDDDSVDDREEEADSPAAPAYDVPDITGLFGDDPKDEAALAN